ncbi:DUF2147 domain-containing protein [Sphingomonas aracearum]|uniref:DUF2147 domain-containing protein n=1 Tax=Sphingomonas aracearum TaxID=2283317 RepID=A0A369W2P6_9SPHN|nr:DUF2147 domain-containing protein [Sphingomonas aracearum]RDE06341.1 DUF2147 domain-containing protein [Sphingomonas aracearum]
MIRLLVLAALVATPNPPGPRPGLAGTWRNASDSVRIRIAPCRGPGLCGTVTSASAKARADAEAGSGRSLIGAQLFSGFEQEDDGLWYGEVYVPDLDRSFSGSIEQRGPDTLVGTGCLFANFGCKTQVWTRVAGAPPKKR